MWADFLTWYTCWVFLCEISHQMVQMYFMELLYCTMKSHPTHVILPLPCIMKKICSGKKAPHVLLFFLSCAGQKFPGKTFQLSHMFVLLLSFESHYFNISIHHSTFYSKIIFVFTYCEVLSPSTCFWDYFHWRGPWLLKRAIVWSGQSHFYKHQLTIGEGRLHKCFKLRLAQTLTATSFLFKVSNTI